MEADLNIDLDARLIKLTPRASPTNSQAITSIYVHSRNKIYNKIIKDHTPTHLDSLKVESYVYRDSPSHSNIDPSERRSVDRSAHLLDIGPSIDSPSSFYYHKRRDMRNEIIMKARSEEAKYSQVKPVELPAIRKTRRKPRSDMTFDKLKQQHRSSFLEHSIKEPLSINQAKIHSMGHRRKHSNMAEQVILPTVNRRKSKYSSKLQEIISACERVPVSSFTHKVNLEQQAISEINRNLEWTTETISRFQDADATTLEHLFNKLEQEQVDISKEISEARRYFKFFSNNPHKQLKMVIKMLRRRKNAVM
jgi:hypothetical protein